MVQQRGLRPSTVADDNTMANILRNRRVEKENTGKASVFNSLNERDVRKTKTLYGPTTFLVIAAFYISIWVLVYCTRRVFPDPLKEISAKSTDFVEERARAHLDKLTALGPRVAGSANNFAAKEYIISEAKKVRASAHQGHEVDIDVQTVSGSFVLDFESIGLGHYSSVYENQHNVVVRLKPRVSSNHSLLVNCHYDTVTDSPGASDDAVSCCLMLEVLRVLAKEEEPLAHNIIFLFNSAEENILQTSHGFITQHKWASSVRAFVNLDSAGAGGWELLFQTGPEHPWLVQTYISAAPRPHASVLGQEIFQFGLVPSDTDFRIFRDFGNISGLDFANIRNGYVYHTKNDLPDKVEPGSMQRGGENLLALVKGLVSSPYFVDPGHYRHGSLVFCDFLGLFMIAYSANVARLINCIIIALVVITTYWSYRCRDKRLWGGWHVHLLLAILMVLFTWIVVIATAVMMGLLVTWFGKDMSYFTYQFNIMWTFVFPSLSAGLSIHLLLKDSLYKQWQGWQTASLYQQANLCLWAVILAYLTYHGIMSAFLPALLMAGPLLSQTAAHCLGVDLKEPRNVRNTILVGSLVPVVYLLYVHQELLSFFIPITGRQGHTSNPDIAIAVVATFPVTVFLPFKVGISYMSERMGKVVRGLGVLAAVGLLAVIFTPLGFPFSSSETSQRLFMVHTDRRFHAISGEVIKHDAQLWVTPLDHHGPSSLLKNKPLFKNATHPTCTGTYCGRPFLYPTLSRLDFGKSLDLPAPYLNVPRATVSLINITHPAPLTHRMTFEMTGPDHVTLFFTPRPGVHVLEWSFGHGAPVIINTLPEIEGDTYFIYYSYGEAPSVPWRFTIDFHVSPGAKHDGIVDMVCAGHHLHGRHQWTEALTHCAQELPDWIVPVGWTATLDSFQF